MEQNCFVLHPEPRNTMTDREYIRQAILDNSADLTVKTDGEFLVLKYRRKVFHTGRWNEFLRMARGLVLDVDYNIVSLPFHKVHNYGIEVDAPHFEDGELVFASRKVNGFMAAATWYNNRVLWSTTGSVSSDFCRVADSIVGSWSQEEQDAFRSVLSKNPDRTYLFECVHADDPHIIPEEPGLYFIGSRQKRLWSTVVLPNTRESQEYWSGTQVKTVWAEWMRFYNLRNAVKSCRHEGFCFTDGSGLKNSKIKSPYYLGKKMLMRANFDRLSSKHKMRLDEEFHPLWEQIHTSGDPFMGLDEMGRRNYIEEYFQNFQQNFQQNNSMETT